MARMAWQLQEVLNRPLEGAGGVSYSIPRPVSFSATSCTSTQLELGFFSELSARPSAIKKLVHMIHHEEHSLRSQHLTGFQSVRSAPITESYHVVYAIRNDEMQVHVVPARVVGAEVATLKGRLASEKARRVSLDDRPTTSHLPDAVSDVSRQVSKGWETIASSWATIVPQTQSSPAATNSPAPSWGAWSLPSLSTWTAAPSASVASQAPEPCYQPHYKGNSGVPDWVPLTTGSPSKGAPPSTRGASDTITPPSSTGTSSWWRWPFR